DIHSFPTRRSSDLLKNAREASFLSQKDVAAKIGVSNSVVSNYERDYRDPDTENLKKLAILFNVSADYLLGLTNVLRRLDHTDYVEIIEDKDLRTWWEGLPKENIKDLKTLKNMWELIKARNNDD